MLVSAAPALLNDECDCPCGCCELVDETVSLYDPATSTFYSSAGEGSWHFSAPDHRRGKTSTTWGSLWTNPKLCWQGGLDARLTIWITPPVVEKAGKYFFFKQMRITWGCDGEFTTGWIPSRAYTITLPICPAGEACTIELEAEYETRSGGDYACGGCAYDASSPLWSEFPLLAQVAPTYGDNQNSDASGCFARAFELTDPSLPRIVPLNRAGSFSSCNFTGTNLVTVNPVGSPCSVALPTVFANGDMNGGIVVNITWSGTTPTVVSYRLNGYARVVTVGYSGLRHAVGDGFPLVVVNQSLGAMSSPEEWCAAILNYCVGKSGTSPVPSPDPDNDGSVTVTIF